ncbi:hypothetical protein ONS95_003605 [Cadophora gregata]|uniref:uncharacterized protein n=1 Tax=Cadophora gregata TaxID=51156 RepID=UPI0026DCB58C|nr:uncharacterized protein ONS95_003605 [Cadophora gregata]KAK0106884.1 hypothetical protein ONS95_003605 [Cadophora gregata]KAK0116575.1 hypothetical protein ONS96_012432 [Cadophora gregata f. sp. sojae]
MSSELESQSITSKLCSKCEGIFSVHHKVHKSFVPREVPISALIVHSPSILSLKFSMLSGCHLCVLIWDVHRKFFAVAAELEENNPLDPVAELCYMFETVELGLLLYATDFKTVSKHIVYVVLEHERSIAAKLYVPDTVAKIQNGNMHLGLQRWVQTPENCSEPTAVMDVTIFLSPETALQRSLAKLARKSDLMDSSGLGGGSDEEPYSWLSHCINRHEKCFTSLGLPRSSWLPTRLLDIRDIAVSHRVKLYCTEPGDSLEYATLSHRWEADDQLRLLTGNIKSFLNGISVETLSKTFQQAIAMCRKLLLNFIWIDSLCILQDSKEDWVRESSTMGKIYINGKVCIAASGAADGCRTPMSNRNPLLMKPLLRKTTKSIFDEDPLSTKQVYRVHLAGIESVEIEASKLQTRGWVVQERALATRTLYLGSNQLFWCCHQGTLSETWPCGIGRATNLDRSLKTAFYTEIGFYYWNQALEIYLRTFLT